MASAQELDITRNPIVQDSLAHNVRVRTPPPLSRSSTNGSQVLQSLRQPTSLLLGLLAGALSLTSLAGFAFYFGGSLLTSLLIYVFLLQGHGRRYFYVAPESVEVKTGTGKKEIQLREAGFSWGLVMNVLFGGGVLGVEGIMGFIMAWTLGFNYIGRGL